MSAANALLQNPDVNAVTLIDTIIFRRAADAEDNIALWAHELKHVQQYQELGVEEFARRYTRNFDDLEGPAYKIEADGKLEASNQIIVNQLTFGTRTDSPDATKLPVPFIVALLQDRHGVIDLDLPLTGSVNDPQFSMGALIWKVIVNLFTKVVCSPFAAIGGGGVTLLADWLVRDDVAAGRLTRLLEQYEVNPGSASTCINALYLPNHRGSSRINVFIDFLIEILNPAAATTPAA